MREKKERHAFLNPAIARSLGVENVPEVMASEVAFWEMLIKSINEGIEPMSLESDRIEFDASWVSELPSREEVWKVADAIAKLKVPEITSKELAEMLQLSHPTLMVCLWLFDNAQTEMKMKFSIPGPEGISKEDGSVPVIMGSCKPRPFILIKEEDGTTVRPRDVECLMDKETRKYIDNKLGCAYCQAKHGGSGCGREITIHSLGNVAVIDLGSCRIF